MDTWAADYWDQGLANQSPLAGDWSSYFTDTPTTQGWFKEMPAPFVYDPMKGLDTSMSYNPGGQGMSYSPDSMFTMEMWQQNYDAWFAQKYPQYDDFTNFLDYQQGAAGVGKVGTAPLGQFHNSPGVDAEIQAAAQKYGVPANFLKVIIAKESSGDWAGNNRTHPLRGESLLPYVGIFNSTANSRGLNYEAMKGNRALQIDGLANILRQMYTEVQAVNPQYGWLNVAAKHYSGDPSGNFTPPDSYQFGTTREYMATTEQWWKAQDASVGNVWSNFTSTGQITGIGSIQNQVWQPINHWDEMVVGAAAKYGVPANLVKAIMRLESNGNPNVRSSQGATGLMQVMPFHVGGNVSSLLDPATNIDVGTRILADNFRQYGTWEMAAKAYLGLGGADANGTTADPYWRQVKTYWDELNAGASGIFTGPQGNSGPSTAFESIWAGGEGNITQGLGEFAGGAYGYGDIYGQTGHPGIDVGMGRQRIYSPVSGTVIRVDNTWFSDVSGSGPNRGELRIKLDNGDELILGHMNSIALLPALPGEKPTRVSPGTFVGISGMAQGDQRGHIHIEYRRVDPTLPSQFRVVDPRLMLGGPGFAGGHQGEYQGLGSRSRPMTYQNLMMAAAKGETIPQGVGFTMGGGSGAWNAWLQSAMKGQVPNMTRNSTYDYTYVPDPMAGTTLAQPIV